MISSYSRKRANKVIADERARHAGDIHHDDHLHRDYRQRPHRYTIVCNYCGRGPVHGVALRYAGPNMRVCKGGHTKTEREQLKVSSAFRLPAPMSGGVSISEPC